MDVFRIFDESVFYRGFSCFLILLWLIKTFFSLLNVYICDIFANKFFDYLDYLRISVNILLKRIIKTIAVCQRDFYLFRKIIFFLIPNIHVVTHKRTLDFFVWVHKVPYLGNDISLSVQRKDFILVVAILFNTFLVKSIDW